MLRTGGIHVFAKSELSAAATEEGSDLATRFPSEVNPISAKPMRGGTRARQYRFEIHDFSKCARATLSAGWTRSEALPFEREVSAIPTELELQYLERISSGSRCQPDALP
jgi:hypothetical protein